MNAIRYSPFTSEEFPNGKHTSQVSSSPHERIHQMATKIPVGSPELTPLLTNKSPGHPGDSSQSHTLQHESSAPSEVLGYMYMLLTGLILACSTLLVRVIDSRYGVTVPHNFYLRSFVHIPLALCYIAAFEKPRTALLSLTKGTVVLLILRGTMGCASIFLMYTSLNYIRAGDCAALFCTSPAFTLMLSHVALGEAVSLGDVISVGGSVFGAWLISRPSNSVADDAFVGSSIGAHAYGCVLALLSALCASCAYVTIRKMGRSVNFMISVLALAVASLATSLAMNGRQSWSEMIDMYGISAVGLVVLLGISSFAAQNTLCLGYQNCRAGRGNIIVTIDVPAAYILAILFLGESPGLFGIVGAICVVSSTVYVCSQQMKRSDSPN